MWKLTLALILTLCVAGPAYAIGQQRSSGEDFIIYSIDVLVARPGTLALTLVGAAVYTVTLPLTYWTRDPTVFHVLVREPAEATFRRCLGCDLGETAP